MRRILLGRVADLPDDRCVAVDAGRAIAIRVDTDVVAFENRCLHQASPLAGGIVRDGILTCPLHFWRYRLPEGNHVGSEVRLPGYPVEIVEGEAWVTLPDLQPDRPMRERLLEEAERWKKLNRR